MSARERRNRGAALVGVLLLGAASCTGTPATQKPVQTPDTAARLARRSIACERRVRELNERKIDGRPRYDKAVVAVAEFVDYYAGALDDTADEKKTREMLDNVQKTVSDFITWADEQLGGDKAAQPVPLETEEMAGELVRFWNENDRRWRQAVAVELKASKLKDWDEVIKRPPGVMP
jgi:hypothetical protein